MTRFVLDAAEYSFSTEHVHFFFLSGLESPPHWATIFYTWSLIFCKTSVSHCWPHIDLWFYCCWNKTQRMYLLYSCVCSFLFCLHYWILFFTSFQLVLSKQFASEGTFRFTSLKAGRHLICLQSSSSRCPLPAGGMLVSSVQPGRSTSLHLPLMQIFKWCVVSLFL